MFCKYCGIQNSNSTNYCKSCGNLVGDIGNDTSINNHQSFQSVPSSSWWKKINTSALIKVLLILGFVAFGVYSSMDDEVIQSNNDAISSMNTGKGNDAISQFQSAAEGATTAENKITTLKNLAYSYSTEGQNNEALETFKKALPLTTVDSFDYYLILGEIANLEHSPKTAQENYYKAYGIRPNDFQINNALAVFYLDVEDWFPQYADYPKGLDFALKARTLDSSNLTIQNLAVAYLLNENYAKSLELFLPMDSAQFPAINLWIGLNYAAQDNTINAKKYFQKYIDSGAETPPDIIEYMRTE